MLAKLGHSFISQKKKNESIISAITLKSRVLNIRCCISVAIKLCHIEPSLSEVNIFKFF